MDQNSMYQWFIITAIAGKEDSIKDTLIEKIRNFGYEDHVKEIKIFKRSIVKEEIFSKNDPLLPKSMKNTKTTKWETTPDGKYKKIRTKIVNKFPGYIFINMIMDKNIWYTIRNTNGVMGFVGSSGKGAMPIPITISEFNNVNTNVQAASEEAPKAEVENVAAVEPVVEKQVYTTDLKIGENVQITVGAFAGTVGTIRNIDLEKGTASVEVEFFGRSQQIETPFSELKKD